MAHESSPNAHGATITPFSAAEWDKLRAEDFQAAKQIVLLMVTIFVMGLIGYSVIDLLIS